MGENPHSQNQLLNQYVSKLEIRFILIDNGLCPDWSREEHTRMRDCFYLILDGQGKITVNGKEFYPKKGDMVRECEKKSVKNNPSMIEYK